ncbi:hypothetical protein B566_EDAN015210 [Ephemera danica]|nr:hypothetical protein B566_EDAN015210 [Ephemera danica]
MKLLCQLVMTSLLGPDLDFDKAKKLTADAKFDEAEVRGGVAALGFVLRSASRHNADAAALDSELQQLGLPRELALAVSRCHAEHGANLAKHLAATSLRLSRLGSVQWRTDVTGGPGENATPVVRLSLGYQNLTGDTEDAAHQEASFCLSAEQLNTLIADLKNAKSRMEELSSPE